MNETFKRFQKTGYTVVRGLLSATEARDYRDKIAAVSGFKDDDWKKREFECPDGVSKTKEFWPIIFNEKLLAKVRQLFGPDIKYTQHSDLHAHRRSSGWHRDSKCRQFGIGTDWQEQDQPYQMVRVAIYLQSYEESSASLGVIPGSHRAHNPLRGWERRAWRKINGLRRRMGSKLGNNCPALEPEMPQAIRTTGPNIPLINPPMRPVYVKTEPGDCLIFDQRLLHCSSDLAGPKWAVFLSYGANNMHTRHHLAYYRHIRKDLGYGTLDPALVEQLKQHDLYLETPDKPTADELAGCFIPENAKSYS